MDLTFELVIGGGSLSLILIMIVVCACCCKPVRLCRTEIELIHSGQGPIGPDPVVQPRTETVNIKVPPRIVHYDYGRSLSPNREESPKYDVSLLGDV